MLRRTTRSIIEKRQSEHAHYILYMFSSELLFGLPLTRSLLSPQTITLSVSFDQHCFCNDACFSTAPSLYLRRKILVSQNKHWCVQIVVCAHPSLHPAAGRQRAEWTHLAHAVRSRRSGFENCCLLLARSLVSPAVEPVEAVEL